ncbi:MAG: hypothetical protein HDT24_08325 [Ruminococcus sp.]|nr:hypothetical protein [Ruminococcus sp.]
MKGKRLKSLGGTVLIMILTVMLVLIIMLMATLTVVTTASQRIYTKYEENQAYYSARSALDVFTQNLLYDKAYYAYTDGGSKITYNYGDGETADMKQGLALQLELYKLKTKDTADADVPKSIQNLLQTEFTTYAGTLTSPNKKDEYLTNFGVVGTATTYESSIVYEVEFPKLMGGVSAGDGSGSHNFGELADKRKARITIEVLSREYNMSDDVLTSGPDVGMKVKDKIATFNGDEDQIKTFLSSPQNYTDVVKAVANGNRKKDKMRLKITATTMIRGVEGTAVLICNSNEPPVNNSSRAITAFGGTGSDNMSILGGMSAENTINWGSNDGFVYGPVYVEEDFLMDSNGPKIYLGSGENLVVGRNLKIAANDHFYVYNNTSPMLGNDDENAPFVFIGGELSTGGGLSGSPFMNVDVVAETIKIGSSSVAFDSSCTMYCSGLEINADDSSYNGDIYVDGDVILGTAYTSDKTGLFTSGGDTPITTAIHKGSGTIYFTGSVRDASGNLPDVLGTGFSQITDHFWVNIPDVADIIDPLPTTAEGDDGTKIEVPLPGRSHNKQLETHVQNFDNYYAKDEDGNRVTVTLPDSTVRPVVKSAQTMADIDTMTDKTKLFTSSDTGISDRITDLYSSGSEYGIDFTRVIDTGGGEVKCIWNETSNSKLRIKGGGTVVLLLDETASWGYSNECMILVDDDTTLKIVGDVDAVGAGGGAWSNTFAKLEVYNQTTYGAVKGLDVGAGVDALKVGSVAGNGIKVPKIYYYFTGSDFKVSNDCRLTGYIYAPDTNLGLASAGSMTDTLQYNGTTTTGTPVCIVGSALVKGATLPNNTGVAYINPDLEDDGDRGDPIHQWQAYQYTRN